WLQGLGLLLPENQGCLPRKSAMNLFLGALGGMRGCFAIEWRQIVYKMKSDDPHACWRIGFKRQFMRGMSDLC
ncbi:hypothetical protein, partial [Aeromonas veronii]|uniref:hypothetical protein n=1 Tax=Aeromonas veronii TaxID=654 RepID=UPI003D1C3886